MTELVDLARHLGRDAAGLASAVEILLRVTAVLSAAMLLVVALRRSSAAVRHLVWTLSLAGTLLVPVGYWAFPGWRWGILPHPEPSPEVAVVETASPEPPVALERPSDALPAESLEPFDVATMPETMPPILGPVAAPERPSAPPVAATEVTADTAAEPAWSWSAVLGVAWAMGTCLGLAWLAVGIVGAWHVARRAVPAADEPWRRLLGRLEAGFALRRPVEVLESPRVSVPMTWGLRRPVILVPASSAAWSEEARRSVLLHELGHIRRGDCLMHLLGRLACVEYWFHPLVWFAARQLRKTGEQAADDVVLASNIAPPDYAAHLVAIAAQVRGLALFGHVALPMATPSDLENRVLAILDPKRNHRSLRRKTCYALVLLAATVLIPCALLRLGYAEAEPPRGQTAATQTVSGDETPPSTEKDNATAKEKQPVQESEVTIDAVGKSDAKTLVIEGSVVDEKGHPEAGVAVRAITHVEPAPAVDTDAAGRFQLCVDGGRARGLVVVARTADATRQAFLQFSYDVEPPRVPPPVRLTLSPARKIDVRVLDGEGKPVADAVVGAVVAYRGLATGRSDQTGSCTLRIPADAPLQSVYAMKSGLGLDYVAFPTKDNGAVAGDGQSPPDPNRTHVLTLGGAKTARIKLLDPEDRPLVGIDVVPWVFEKERRPRREVWDDLNISGVADFRVKTGADGVAVFDWLPAWQSGRINFWPQVEKDYWAPERIMVDLKAGESEVTARLVRTVPVHGQVRFADGRPAEGIWVQAGGAGYQTDGFRESTRTGADGRFEFRVYPDQLCMFVVSDSEWAAPARTGIIVRPDTPVDGIDFQLQPAVRIHGQVTIGPEKKPLAGHTMTLIQYGPDNLNSPAKSELPNPTNSNVYVRSSIVQWATTDAEGCYQLHVGPGEYDLRGPDNSAVQKLSVGNQESLVFDFHTSRPDRGVITGRVVLEGKEPQPVADAEVTGISRAQAGHAELFARTDAEGRFRVERWLDQMTVYAKSKDGKLAGIVEVGPDDKEVTIPVRPVASAAGRLVDATNGQPLADREIQYGVRIHDLKPDGSQAESWSTRFGGTTKSDAEGRFTLEGLTVGAEYDLSVPVQVEGDPPNSGRRQSVGNATPKGRETIDLGNLELKPPYHPPTLQERIAAAFNKPGTVAERLDRARKDARLAYKRVLIVLADPQSEACQQICSLYFDDTDAQKAFADYQLLPVNTKDGLGVDVEAVAKTGVKKPMLVVFDVDGKMLANSDVGEISTDGRIDRQRLVDFLKAHAPTPPDAETLLADALASAVREEKRVLVEESGAFCGWCVVLARFLDAHREVLGRDYVVVTIDRDRFAHGGDVMDRVRTAKEGGIPWMAILDAQGKVLVTSDAPGGNIGYPAKPEEIDHFMKMLGTTAKRLTPDDLAALRKDLEAAEPAKAAAQEKQQAQESDKSAEARVDVLAVTPDGRPVADAEVLAWNRAEDLQYRTYRTDASGRVSIPWARPALSNVFGLIARHGEDVGWHGDQPGPDIAEEVIKQPIKITLFSRSQTVEGTCVDAQGRPIAGVCVRVTGLGSATNGGFLTSGLHEDPLGGAVSDAEGRYSIKLPEFTVCRVLAEHPKFVVVESSHDAGGKPGRIVLSEPAGTIQGQVVDMAGAPVRGARIFAQALERGRSAEAGVRAGVSDENGRYTLGSTAPGLWNVMFGGIAEHRELTAAAAEGVEVKAGETAAADFRLAPGRRLCGQVIDAAKNTPLAGVSVGYYGAARPRSGAACLMVETDAEGRFEFHVPPGESRVYVAQGFRGKPSSRTLIIEPENDPEPVVFRGALSEPGGMVAAAAPLAEKEASSDAAGDDTSYTIRGTLRASDGKPVPGAIIKVWTPHRSGPSQVGYQETRMFIVQGGDFSNFLGIRFLDDQGRRQIEMEEQYYRDKIGKPWYLVVDAAGYARPQPIEFTFGKEIKPVAIVLERPIPVSVRGRVLDAHGQPVAKANVSVSLGTVGDAAEEPWGPEYLTAPDGRFELKQVHVGNRFAVCIEKEHYLAAVSPRMLVERADPIDLGNLRLKAADEGPAPPKVEATAGTASAKPSEPSEPPPATLTASGKVVDPAGKPVAGATVYLREWSTYRISQDAFKLDTNDVLATTETDAAGGFRFENVAARPLNDQWLGEIPWDVVVVAKSYAMAWRHLDAARQAKPWTITLAPEATITGRVTDRQGKPIPGADVSVFAIDPPGSDWPCHAYADPDMLDLQRSRLSPAAKTDAEGKVTIGGLPRDARLDLFVTHPDFQHGLTFVATTDQPQRDIVILEYAYGGRTALSHEVYRWDFSAELGPPLPRLLGRIMAADTKKPLTQSSVSSHGRGTLTDEEGRFTLAEILDSRCSVVVFAPKDSDYLGRIAIVDVPRDKRETQADIELERGEVLSGIVVDGATGKGVAGVNAGFEMVLEYRRDAPDRTLTNGATTDREGRFRVVVPPGKGKVGIFGVVPGYDLRRPGQERNDIVTFVREVEVIAGKPTGELKFAIRRLAPEEEKSVERREAAGRSPSLTRAQRTVYWTVEGTVVDPDGKPAAGAEVRLSPWPLDVQLKRTDADGRFSLGVAAYSRPRVIVAIDEQRRLHGHATVEVKSPVKSLEESLKATVEIHLVPTGTITGLVLEEDKPVADEPVEVIVSIPTNKGKPGAAMSEYSELTKTNENGRFTFPFVEADSEVNVVANRS
ncbi:MAG: carboxypeptidase regulatory-like domain-containing protein, partial [Planctomycetia bacterium]|nr:carboxypeptidase regulatory-like domain-containing protein [Planctomycetia bacterium]